MALPMDYRGIRVWHVDGDLPGNWRELQKRAWRESAPLDALYVDYAGRWICARDLAARSLDSCDARQRPGALQARILASGSEINAAGLLAERDAVRAPSPALKRELAEYARERRLR